MTEVVVRRSRPEDAELFRRIRLAALATDPASFGSTYEREAAYDDDVWAERAAQGATGNDSATLLALRGDEPIGVVGSMRDETEPEVFLVYAMWVDPQARREGIGQRLLAEIEDWISTSGGTVVSLSVTNEAQAARRFYEKSGYRPDGSSTESRHTDGLVEIGLRKLLSR
ncbi:MAG: N-acetyltransferase family protein [Gaiellaceae bacterium]